MRLVSTRAERSGRQRRYPPGSQAPEAGYFVPCGYELHIMLADQRLLVALCSGDLEPHLVAGWADAWVPTLGESAGGAEDGGSVMSGSEGAGDSDHNGR